MYNKGEKMASLGGDPENYRSRQDILISTDLTIVVLFVFSLIILVVGSFIISP